MWRDDVSPFPFLLEASFFSFSEDRSEWIRFFALLFESSLFFHKADGASVSLPLLACFFSFLFPERMKRLPDLPSPFLSGMRRLLFFSPPPYS